MSGGAPDREQLELMLVDYLYDDLDPQARGVFERALADHPDLQAEVEEELALLGRAATVSFEERAPQAALDAALAAARAAVEGARSPDEAAVGTAAGVDTARRPQPDEVPGALEIAGVRVVREGEPAQGPAAAEIAGVCVGEPAQGPTAASWLQRLLAWLTTPPVLAGAAGAALLAVGWVALPALLGGQPSGPDAPAPAPVLVAREERAAPASPVAEERRAGPTARTEATSSAEDERGTPPPTGTPGTSPDRPRAPSAVAAPGSLHSPTTVADSLTGGALDARAPAIGGTTRGLAAPAAAEGGREVAKAAPHPKLPRRGKRARRAKAKKASRATLQVASANEAPERPAARPAGGAPAPATALTGAAAVQAAMVPAQASAVQAPTASPKEERRGSDLAKKVEERLAAGDLAGARAALEKLKRLTAWRQRAKELAQAVAAAERKAAEAAPPPYSNRPAASKRSKVAPVPAGTPSP